MKYYRALIQYDGSGYAGFQWQKDAPTIQDELNKALRALIPGKFTTMGASRTDAGVHAHAQVLKVTGGDELLEHGFAPRLNTLLPPQIRCLSFESCSGSFNPAQDKSRKEYRYLFTNQARVSMADRRFIANMAVPLDISLMQACVAQLEGLHNFQNFYSTGSNVRTTEREIFSAELTRIDPREVFNHNPLFTVTDELTHCYQLRLVGNGFLKQMIRHLMSALWVVGSDKLSRNDFTELLTGPRQNKQRWRLATPRGLHLYSISYRDG